MDEWKVQHNDPTKELVAKLYITDAETFEFEDLLNTYSYEGSNSDKSSCVSNIF